MPPRIREIYDGITTGDYIGGILSTTSVWKEFIQKLKPACFIASQYHSEKLSSKGLRQRQNSGLIVRNLLQDFYESYLKKEYRQKSFGRQKGDPAWWIVASRPYV